MEQRRNQRVMLTKRLLKESLTRLMEKTPIQKISVSELCREAGINRVTFYNHYSSPSDLLQEMEQDLADEIHTRLVEVEKGLDPHRPMHTLVETICEYLQENRNVSKLLFQNNPAESDFAVTLFRIPGLWEKMCQLLSDFYSEEGKDLIITFLTHGSYSMIRQWLLTDSEKTPQEMGRLADEIYVKGPDLEKQLALLLASGSTP